MKLRLIMMRALVFCIFEMSLHSGYATPPSSQAKRSETQRNQTTLYVDTGILEFSLNRPRAIWTIGIWRGGELQQSQVCGGAKCDLSLNPELLKALVSYWIEETHSIESSPELQDQASKPMWLPPKPTTVPPLRDNPDEVWIGWGKESDEPQIRVSLDHIKMNRSLITQDDLLATREPVHVPITFPELVTEVDCTGAECALIGDKLRVVAIDRRLTDIEVVIKLKRGVKSLKSGRWTKTQERKLRITRCVLVNPPNPLLADQKRHNVIFAMARGCGAGAAQYLHAEVKPKMRSRLRELLPDVDPEWRFFEVELEEVPKKKREINITVLKKLGPSLLLGELSYPVVEQGHPRQISFQVSPIGKLDFIPTNQTAQMRVKFDPLSFHGLNGPADIIPQDLPGYYEVQPLPTATEIGVKTASYMIKAESDATGVVPILFSYQPRFPPPFDRLNPLNLELVRFTSKVNIPMKPLNTPIQLTTDSGEDGVASLQCIGSQGEREVIRKGLIALIPYQSRHSCQVLIRRDRIPPRVGTQHIEVAVIRGDSTGKKPEYKRLVTVKHGTEPLVISLPMKRATEFERIEITIGHGYASARYDFAPRQDLGVEARYDLVLGDRSWSVSLSTSMPTGLFRYGIGGDDREAISLSAGGLGRFLWLYSEGRPFPLGLELGALVTGIDGDPHLSVVGGIGLSVPVLNANTPFEASFNLHAWFEYSPSRVESDRSPIGFLFGPSFAVGKFSTQL